MANVPNFGYNYPLIEDQYIFKQAKVNSLICFSQKDESFGQFYEDILNPTWWTSMFQYYQNPSEGIFSVMIYPFSLYTDNPSEKKQVKVYNQWTPNSYYVYTGLGQYRNFKLGEVTIKPKYNSILDYKPYTKIFLNLPFYGELELDNVEVMGKTLIVNYNVDLLNGSTTIYVDIKNEIPYTYLEHDYRGNRTIFTTTINLGQSIPMKASGNYAQTKESMRALGSAIMGLTMMSVGVPSSSYVTSKVKLGATTTSNLPVPMGGGGGNDIDVDAWETTTRKVTQPGNRFMLYSGMHGLKSSLTQASNISQISGRQITNAQSGSGWFGSLNMYVRYERHKIIDNQIAKYNGKPLYESRKLGNLEGMTKVENVILDNCPLKEYEKEQLIKYLYEGIILKLTTISVSNVSLSGTYTIFYQHKIEVSNISLSGNFSYTPKVKVSDVSLKGEYQYKHKLEVSNVKLNGTYKEYPQIKVSDVTLSGEYTNLKFNVSNVKLSGTYIERTKVSVSNVKLSGLYTNLKLKVSNISLSGKYMKYDDSVYFITNDNEYFITSDNEYFTTINTIVHKLSVSNVSLSGTYTNLKLNVSNVKLSGEYKYIPKVVVSNAKLSGLYTNLKFNVSNVKLNGTYKEYPKVNVSNVKLSGLYTNLKFKVSNVKLSGTYILNPKVNITNVKLSGTYTIYTPTSYTLNLFRYVDNKLKDLKTFDIAVGTTINPGVYAKGYTPSGTTLTSYSPTSSFVMYDNAIIRGYYTSSKVSVSNVKLTGTYTNLKVKVSNVKLKGTYNKAKTKVTNVKLKGTYTTK